MSEKGMIFTTESVKAILNGRKTQTRRVVQPDLCDCIADNPIIENGYVIFTHNNLDKNIEKRRVPYKPGDILWVRETFCPDWCDHVIYKADGGSAKEAGYASEPKWRSPRYMPRATARLFLRITDVCVERLQDMAAADVRAEGIKAFTYNFCTFPCIPSTLTEKHICNSSGMFDDNSRWYREWYADLWNKINGQKNRGAFKWDMNPFVWVYTFERVGEGK